jgi:very-short-patch-repair endonuclease
LNKAALESQGWTVLRIWEHQVKTDVKAALRAVLKAVRRPGLQS